MKNMKFMLMTAVAVLALASCKSKMSDADVEKKASEQFEAKKTELQAEADKNCSDMFDTKVNAEAEKMATEKMAAMTPAAPAK